MNFLAHCRCYSDAGSSFLIDERSREGEMYRGMEGGIEGWIEEGGRAYSCMRYVFCCCPKRDR